MNVSLRADIIQCRLVGVKQAAASSFTQVTCEVSNAATSVNLCVSVSVVAPGHMRGLESGGGRRGSYHDDRYGGGGGGRRRRSYSRSPRR